VTARDFFLAVIAGVLIWTLLAILGWAVYRVAS
jgi:hypothetical protein